MAVLEILTFPNPILRTKGKRVEAVTDEIRQLASDMIETMYASKGIGLAAPQIGRSFRVLVIDTRPRENGRYTIEEMTELEQAAHIDGPMVIINPEIVKKKGKQTYEEGCLSVPSYYESVERYDYIECEALNEKGEKILLKLDGLMSVCIQHEIDHLDGKLFIDRLSLIKGQRIKEKILKNGYPSPSDSSTDDSDERVEGVSAGAIERVDGANIGASIKVRDLAKTR